jgi:hypothetical protein
MADLAGYTLVVGCGSGRLHISVTESALLAPSVGFLQVPDGVHRCSPIMTKVPEGVRDQEIPGDQEGGTHQGKDQEKTRDLLRHAVHPFRPRTGVSRRM